MADPQILAAVDLGSNSFRLEIGRVSGGQIYTLDALREPVRLASGLNREKQLTREAFDRGIATLDRFGERLRGMPPENVRAVATNTLRVARNAKSFLQDGERRLGFPIEVIGGREEARLIYFGVAHLLEPGPSRRLVVDIGGGSTEVIIGTGHVPEVLESVYVGCVSYSLRFFDGGRYDKGAFKQAELAARRELEVVSQALRKRGWVEAIGSSGTARALAELCEANGFSGPAMTHEGLERLKAALLKAGDASALRLVGLKADRIPVLAGGLSIMLAVFAELGVTSMSVSDGALRTGVLYDLLGRAHREDMREVTVRDFMQRYQVENAHAERVSTTALQFWRELDKPNDSADVARADRFDDGQRILRWASLLHEIGLSLSHNGYHKHSAYMLSNADMPGFSRREQARIAALVLGHTGKLPKMRDLIEAEDDWRLVLCLRLSALLYRSRNEQPLPPVALSADKRAYALEIPRPWLDGNPLTEYDLRLEIEEWHRLGKDLKLAS